MTDAEDFHPSVTFRGTEGATAMFGRLPLSDFPAPKTLVTLPSTLTVLEVGPNPP